jgi:hypothetical protein
MGYAEMFCLACGGPCIVPDIDSMQDMYEDAEERNERVKIKKMINKLEKMKLKWVEKWIGVAKDGIYEGTPGSDAPIYLENLKPIDEKYPEYKGDLFWCFEKSNVFAFHKSCWTVIGKPSFQELTELNLKRKSYNNHVKSSAYPFDKLMNQQFDYVDLKSSDLFRLEDPSLNELSRQNVLGTWNTVKTHTQ